METIIINNKRYYLAKDVVKTYEEHFNGCKRRVRDILTKKKIDKKDYLFVNGKKNKPIKNQEKPANRDKLLLRKKWVENILSNKPKYEILPNKIELSDEQKFKDNKGNVYDINVCGELKLNTCWFKASDIGKVFGIKNITGTLEKLSSSFITNKDYKTFIVNKIDNVSLKGNNRVLYLSYTGVLRLIFVSRSKMADLFVKWASETLFTIQFGTKEEKLELASNQLGLDVTEFTRLTNVTKNISCIYLLLFGKVDELGDSFKLDDYNKEHYVCKYGLSNDMSRRITEHRKDYGKLGIDNIEMLYFIPIDEGLLDKAEKELRDNFKTFNYNEDIEDINEKVRKELVVLDKKTLKKVKKLYNKIGEHFGSRATTKAEETLRENEQVHKDLQTAKIRIKELEENIKRERERISRLEKKNDRLEYKIDKLEDKKDILEEKLRELLMNIKVKNID